MARWIAMREFKRTRAAVMAALKAAEGPESWTLGLVRSIDLAYREQSAAGRYQCVSLLELVLAKATAAVAPLLAEQASGAQRERILATGDAAAAFVGTPCEQSEEAFQDAAAASYPFGPGDGCLAVAQLGGHGTPGAGCASGAGFLWDVGHRIGFPRLQALLRREVLTWLGELESAPEVI